MAPPSNTDITTAYDLGAVLPVSYTQEAHDAGTTYDLWFKITVPAGVTEIGPWLYGDFATYSPVLRCWLGPTGAPTQLGGTPSTSVPMQVPVDEGITVYFESRSLVGNPNPALTTIDILAAPSSSAPAGSVAINDSNDGYPLVLLSGTTADPLRYLHPFPAGESIRVLTTGEVMVSDPNGVDNPLIYSSALTLTATPALPATGYDIIGTDQTTGWWVGKADAGFAKAVFVAKNGTVTPTVYNLGLTTLKALTPNLANDVLYFIRTSGVTNTPILQIDTATSTVTTFVAGVVGKSLKRQGLLTLTDDTVLAIYQSSPDPQVRQFDAAGTLLHTYTITGMEEIEQIFAAIDDPDSFWLWCQPSTEFSHFINVKISDGSYLHDLTSTKFVQGVFQGAESATPSARFGTDNSCAPWVIRAPSVEIETFTIRRQRRWLLPQSESNKRIQIPLLELLMRTGIGLLPDAAGSSTPLGVDPEVRLRISKDGGKTWGPERARSAGLRGEFKDRVRWTRATGNYRNGVGEVTVDAPMDWQWLAMMGDPTEGSS